MSKKYNEIMDKVVVTDEMRDRLLARIANADTDRLKEQYKVEDDAELAHVFSGRKRNKPETAKILAFLAAACALIIVVGIGVMSNGRLSEGTAVMMNENAIAEEAEETEEAAVVEEAAGADDAGRYSETAKADDAVQHSETAKADNVVGAPGNTKEGYDAENTNDAVNGPATGGASAEAADDRADYSVEPVTLSEAEIRDTVRAYFGDSYKITDMTKNSDLLVYTISYAASGKVCSYIRIYMSTGKVEIEDIRTREIKEMYFRDLTAP